MIRDILSDLIRITFYATLTGLALIGAGVLGGAAWALFRWGFCSVSYCVG